ncbi:Cytoplasmic tRNA 2-thiolation protein 1 [Galdieria sulphuraria]|nr:Cytoplasmic tRNA 2-thiolation protein 1 [Galdieria sulphuraria]
MKRLCSHCGKSFANILVDTVHRTIVEECLLQPGERIAIGASGGKDSTVLAYVLKLLNERYYYNWDLWLLSIDEGIQGYRDDSLRTVEQNRDDYNLPLYTLSYSELYNWTMDQVVSQIGRKSNCTFCGVFRRQALDKGTEKIQANVLATGHNADDIAETILLNLLRGDHARFSRSVMEENANYRMSIDSDSKKIRRVKPLKRVYEKEIVMYAYFKKLKYFATECIYAPFAYRGHAREYLKSLERIRPHSISDILYSLSCISLEDSKTRVGQQCIRCGSISSQNICKACLLRTSLDRGQGVLAVKRSGMAILSKNTVESEIPQTVSESSTESNIS